MNILEKLVNASSGMAVPMVKRNRIVFIGVVFCVCCLFVIYQKICGSNRIKDVAHKYRIGILTDVQYADIPDGWDFPKEYRRYYRGSIQHVQRALESWGIFSSTPNVEFIINLGDIIDGLCKRNEQTKKALSTVGRILGGLPVPVYHLIGNHDLMNMRRSDIVDTFLFSKTRKLSKAVANELIYFSITSVPGFRLVFLDAYDIACIGRSRHDPRCLTMLNWLKKKRSDPAKLNFHLQRSGGIGQDQLVWLDNELLEARRKQEYVIIFSHSPIDPCCVDINEVYLNWEEVTALLRNYSDVVTLVVNGHTHLKSHGVDSENIHHVILPGLVETPFNKNGVATLELSDKEVRLKGDGWLTTDVVIRLK